MPAARADSRNAATHCAKRCCCDAASSAGADAGVAAGASTGGCSVAAGGVGGAWWTGGTEVQPERASSSSVALRNGGCGREREDVEPMRRFSRSRGVRAVGGRR
jgi:hypothetical protein